MVGGAVYSGHKSTGILDNTTIEMDEKGVETTYSLKEM